MEITVLGHRGAFPGAGEATSGYLLQSGRSSILMDCGSGVLSQLFRYIRMGDLHAALISHYHHDHIADLGCLQYASLVTSQLGQREAPLPIYAHAQSERFQSLTMKDATVGYEIQEGQRLELCGISFEFCPTIHSVHCLAIKGELSGKAFGYTADTSYSKQLSDFFNGCELLIAESSFYADQDASAYGHMNAADAARMASEAGVSRLILSHLPHFGDTNDMVAQAQEVFAGSVELAYIGARYEL
jgi:ribonuclease BN (tRNA processing enzyme)